MKVKFVQFYCLKHRILLEGMPEFVLADDAYVPSMAWMRCNSGESVDGCKEHWIYDIEIVRADKLTSDL